MDSPRIEERSVPECIRLGVRPGHTPSRKPPVRVFLATEPAQYRAERVFVWSIEQQRDPSRVYEIHLMKGLTGFERRRWTTGFTNYRFAIPHYASAEGRAIYNDVDQIYLDDPAKLFDTDLAGHGYLAITPKDNSVMLLDCARMAEIWTLEAARRESKAALLRRATRVPGLHGPLDGEWNARDGEFREGRSRCLHYTNLHTQPWSPFPERFVYQHNEQGHLWFELERTADEAGFQIFSRDRPSALYRALEPDPPLERVPQDDLPWVLDALLQGGPRPVRIEVRCDPPGGVQRGPDGGREPRRSAAWWSEWLDAAGARNPGVRWEATMHEPGGRVRRRSGGPTAGDAPPRVWVLTEDRAGNTSQSLGLADALGWPWERKRIQPGRASVLHNRLLGASLRGVDRARSDPLEPPWPDLVIAAGRRTAPVALWLREQSEGSSRLVHLGRKGGDHAALFDLAVTPTYTRLFPHPRRLEVGGPLHRITPERLAEARVLWKERLEPFPTPRIVLLVGGTSGQYRLDVATARRLGRDVARMAREAGGSVLASTSRRTRAGAVQALREELRDAPGCFHRAGDPDENPYLGYLAFADELVLTADSESMLMEAASLGQPLSIYPLPERRSFRLLNVFRELTLRRATAQPAGPRGTGRPQRGLELLCARLIERGFVRPARDLSLMHRDLIRQGLARPFGAPATAPRPPPVPDALRVAARVRSLMGVPG